MDTKTITQQYLMLVTNEKGRLSLMYGTEAKAGIVVAGIMDLVLSNVIKIEKKKAEVMEELPKELAFLSSLYGYLQEKTRSVKKVVEDYSMSITDTRLNQFIADIGKSLIACRAAREEKGGLFGNKNLFIPSQESKEELINSLKTEVMQSETLTLHNIVLVSLLKETKSLQQYFSKHETGILQEKLKAIKNNPESKTVKEMLACVDEVMMVIIAATSVVIN